MRESLSLASVRSSVRRCFEQNLHKDVRAESIFALRFLFCRSLLKGSFAQSEIYDNPHLDLLTDSMK